MEHDSRWQLRSSHLFDLKGWNHHALYDVWKQRGHIVIAHGHIRNYLLERYLLLGEVLVLLVALEFGAQLGDFALQNVNTAGRVQIQMRARVHTRAKKRASPPPVDMIRGCGAGRK